MWDGRSWSLAGKRLGGRALRRGGQKAKQSDWTAQEPGCELDPAGENSSKTELLVSERGRTLREGWNLIMETFSGHAWGEAKQLRLRWVDGWWAWRFSGSYWSWSRKNSLVTQFKLLTKAQRTLPWKVPHHSTTHVNKNSSWETVHMVSLYSDDVQIWTKNPETLG